ncbi:MurR/RpiR family transcriptional regulator [Fusobacterium necrophorum]|uniref:MurR/RpiR family transcriptional regulator n=1 Tax=Fusobacterium necrophorum TaxID=859 RepID=A0A4Q2KW35_9FUSO|nr:MurR/RpiR family transcriptional regulator [Fusobacterium necrophorum]RXZ69805.1 MurR/RpiR family transcriptional regulator [Fusobacterium necrophorum]
MQALYEKIRETTLTKTEKKIARFFLESEEDIFFMTSKEIADLLQISDTSIIRFVKHIGFENFTKFRDFIKNNLQSKMSSFPQFMENMEELKYNSVEQSLVSQMNKNISALFETKSLESMEKIIDTLWEAENRYIIGLKSTVGLANFFGIRLSFILGKVYTFVNNDTILFNSIRNMKKEDVLFLFDYPTYSREMTLLCRVAKERGAKIILISDTPDSPCSIYADIHFTIKIKGISLFHSLISSQFFVEYLLSSISKKMTKEQKREFLIWKKLLAERG